MGFGSYHSQSSRECSQPSLPHSGDLSSTNFCLVSAVHLSTFSAGCSRSSMDKKAPSVKMDDMLIHGRDQQEHDTWLNGALKWIQEAGLTLNPDKCEFSQDKLTFLSHVIDGRAISPDLSKTNAVLSMESPTNTIELRQCLGMVNQLIKFSAHLAELSQPLRELLSHKKAWLWGPAQEAAFRAVKEELAKPTTLVLYYLHCHNHGFCLLLLLWSWCSSPPEATFRIVGTNCLCLTCNDTHRAMLFANREGSTSPGLGL